MSHRTTKTNKMTCATSEDSDQTERIWASNQSNQSLRCPHEETLGPYSYTLSTQRRLGLDWAVAQADLRLRLAHGSCYWFCHAHARILIRAPLS